MSTESQMQQTNVPDFFGAANGIIERLRSFADVKPISVEVNIAPLVNLESLSQATSPCNMTTIDWDHLFSAVKDRLRVTVQDRPDAIYEPQPALIQMRKDVLECLEALDQLQLIMMRELGQRQQLEMEVFSAKSALNQVRADLAGTRDGERRARHLAMHDSLTTLPNRDYFYEQLDAALKHSEPERRGLAILYLDLDGFKQINDTHGHDIGDDLLRIVAARLACAIRAEDVVCHTGWR